MADIERVKRNVQRMAEAGAPVEDIDAYVASEGLTPEQLSAPVQQPAKASFTAKSVGENLPSPARGGMAALQGPTFGFLDELAGAGYAGTGAITGDPASIPDMYREGRDIVRGATESYTKENPMTSLVTQLAAAAPAMMWNPAQKAQAVGNLGRIWQTMKTAGVTGGIQAGGESTAETPQQFAADVAKGGATSMAIGGGMSVGGQTIGAVGGNIMSRVNNAVQNSGLPPVVKNTASRLTPNYAQQKVAEALLRDSRTISQTEARLRKMGPRAMFADAAGENTSDLLDLVASLPGQAKDKSGRALRERAASRGNVMFQAAEDSLETNGQRLGTFVDDLVAQRRVASEPFYNQINGLNVKVGPRLRSLLDRAEGNFKKAEKLYKIKTGQDLDLASLQSGDVVPFKTLDTVKQALYDAGSKAKTKQEKALAMELDQLRVELTSALDDISPKDRATGESIYKLARDAYSGPSQMKDAAELGREVFNKKPYEIAQEMKGMTKSEYDAFKVGVLQGVREKVGTEAGQTSLMKMWKEISTQDRLKQMFGGSYRKFAAEVAKEARFKQLEQKVNKNSATFKRLAGAEDLDISAVADAAGAVGSGNPASVLRTGQNLWRQVSTPESVRDEIGNILLSRQQSAMGLLPDLQNAVDEVTRARLQRANLAGGWAGLLPDF